MISPEETVQVKRRRNRLTEILGPIRLELHRKGLTPKIIAEQTKVCEQTVIKFLLSNGQVPNGWNKLRDEMTPSETMVSPSKLPAPAVLRPEGPIQKPVSELDLNVSGTPKEISDNEGIEPSKPMKDAPTKDVIKEDSQLEIYLVWPESRTVFYHGSKSASGFVRYVNSSIKIQTDPT